MRGRAMTNGRGGRAGPAGRAVRLPVVAALVRPLARAIDWLPVGLAGPLTVALAIAVEPGDPMDSRLGLLLLRMSGLLLGAAAGFALVDAMAAGTDAAPVPRWVRQWARVVLVLAAVVPSWAAVCAVVAVRLEPAGVLHFPGAGVEAAACVLAGLAGSAVAVRRHGGRPAALAGAFVLLALCAGIGIAGGAAWPMPYSADWHAVHVWWLAALPVPVLVLVAAGRDVRRA
ncbi:hypothetical protein [Microtetraspora glauca]|uniref:DUF998 domain-containing protein n=1 Tax=Microtetraspora glauca TaxID=1996 RepID=A0ABV3GRG9_MICGL